MKSTKKVLQEVTESTGQDYEDNIKMLARELAEIAMVEYAKAVVDDILSKPSMIYVKDGEAVYDYEKFGEYTKSL